MATASPKIHVVIPQEATEDVAAGMRFEYLIWSLVGLILQQGSVEHDKVMSLETEIKDNLKMSLPSMKGERNSLRSARMDTEACSRQSLQ